MNNQGTLERKGKTKTYCIHNSGEQVRKNPLSLLPGRKSARKGNAANRTS
jgi:hypothetical protein